MKFKVHGFPLTRGERQFAGSASFALDLAGVHIHCYDMALYVNKSNPVWGNTTDRKRALDALLGDTVFVIETKSSFVSRKALAGFVDRLAKFAAELRVPDYAPTLESYKEMLLKGPKVSVGSEVLLAPGTSFMEPSIDGALVGYVNSTWLGRVILEAYLGHHSDLPEFRDQVWATLAEGFPSEVSEPALVSASMRMPPGIIVAIVLGCLAAILCFSGSVRCLVYRCSARAKSEVPP